MSDNHSVPYKERYDYFYSGSGTLEKRFEKDLNVMEVATITGHKDLRMLQRYTHLRAKDLAKKLG